VIDAAIEKRAIMGNDDETVFSGQIGADFFPRELIQVIGRFVDQQE
jgi:hypothetical protein